MLGYLGVVMLGLLWFLRWVLGAVLLVLIGVLWVSYGFLDVLLVS